MLRKSLYLLLGVLVSMGDVKPASNYSVPSSIRGFSVGFSSTNFVQVAGNLSETSVSTLKVPMLVTAGHTLFVSVVEGSTPAITLTDKLGDTFTRIQTDNNGNLVRTISTYYALNIKGGQDTIIAAFSGGTNHTRIIVAEYQGIVGLDTAAKIQANAGQPSITLPARQASDLSICAIETNVDTLKAVGFTLRKAQLDMDVLDSTITSAGTVTCAGTLARSQSWMLQLANFKTFVAAGSLPQNVTVNWKPSKINAPDSISGYWLNIYRNGKAIGNGGAWWVQGHSTDTLVSLTIPGVPAPDSGRTADYIVAVRAVSSKAIGGQCCAASATGYFLYRRTNTAIVQLPLDSVTVSVKMAVQPSFGIFGDSFRLYRRIYTDTISTSINPMIYIGSAFPRNTLFVAPKQARTNRYSYYITPFLFGSLVDTIYLGTMEFNNP